MLDAYPLQDGPGTCLCSGVASCVHCGTKLRSPKTNEQQRTSQYLSVLQASESRQILMSSVSHALYSRSKDKRGATTPQNMSLEIHCFKIFFGSSDTGAQWVKTQVFKPLPVSHVALSPPPWPYPVFTFILLLFLLFSPASCGPLKVAFSRYWVLEFYLSIILPRL